MRLRQAFAGCLLVFLVVPALPLPALADEPARQQAAPPVAGADLEALMKAATLSPQQQYLTRRAGDWTFTWRIWMAPGQPPAEATGTMHAETSFGGRYLESHWAGELWGKPFQVRATDAWDDTANKFVSISVEIGAGMAMAMGTCNDALTSCNYSGPFWQVANGQQNTFRSVITWNGDDSFTTEVFGKDPDGFEAKFVEIVATRKP